MHKNGGRDFAQKIGSEILHKKGEGSYFVQEILGSENLEKKTRRVRDFVIKMRGRRFCTKMGEKILHKKERAVIFCKKFGVGEFGEKKLRVVDFVIKMRGRRFCNKN